MQTGPGLQPPESAGTPAQSVEYGPSPTHEQLLHARETINMVVDDAAYIRANALHADFNVNGSVVLVAALSAAKRDPDQPHDLKNHTAVHIGLVDPGTDHIMHDMRLDEGYAGSGPTIQYFDHDDRGNIRERFPQGSPRGHFTLQDVASASVA